MAGLKRDWRTLGAIALLALSFRAVCLFRVDPAEPRKGDAANYLAIARNLLDGAGYADQRGNRADKMPGYPLFAAAGLALTGRSERGLQVLQLLLGTALVLVFYDLALGLWGRRWAAAAGVLAALYYDFAFGSVRFLSEQLYVFFLAAFLWSWFRLKDKGATKRALGIGLSLGAAYLTRPEIAPYLGGLGVVLPFTKGFRPKHGVLILGCWVVLAAPWWLRNHAVFDQWVLNATSGGQSTYIGLRETLEKRLGRPAPVPPFVPDREGMDELEISAVYYNEARRFMRALPPSDLLLVLSYNAAVLAYPFLPEYDASFVFILPFALCGLWAGFRSPQWWPVVILPLYLSAIYLVVGATITRYREPLAPALLLLAMLGLHRLKERHPELMPKAVGAWAGANLLILALGPRFRTLALSLKEALWG